jgi:hypothetical protein
MSTSTVSPSRFAAAACATIITAASAWMFMSSSASVGRDPFRFSEVMATNAQIHAAQLAQDSRRKDARVCWIRYLADWRPASSSGPECRKG